MTHPAVFFLKLAVVWTVATIVAPFSFSFPYTIYPTFLLAGITLSFLFGAYIVAPYGIDSHSRTWQKPSWTSPNSLSLWINSPTAQRTLTILIIVAAAGCALRAHDRLFTRGLLSADSVTEARLNLLDAGESSGPIGAISGIAFSLTYSAYFVGRLLWPHISLARKCLVVSLAAYPVLEGFAQGGIMASAASMLFYYFANRSINAHAEHNRTEINTTISRLKWVGAALLLAIASAVFLDRIDKMFGAINVYMEYAESDGTIIYSPLAHDIVELFGAIGFIPIWLIHYFTLGIHEFYFLVNNFQGETYFHGTYQFYIFIKFFKLLGIFKEINPEEFYDANPMPGHYQTFWGPGYMDFGPFVIVEALICGMIAAKAFNLYRLGHPIGVIVYPYILVYIIIGFLGNAIVGERLYFLVTLMFTSVAITTQLKKYPAKNSSDYKLYVPNN